MIETLKFEVENKPDKQDFNQFMNEQSLINEFLCTENIVGRWKWDSGMVSNQGGASLVPWEVQTINTLADNFIWEKGSSFITVITPGLYKVKSSKIN